MGGEDKMHAWSSCMNIYMHSRGSTLSARVVCCGAGKALNIPNAAARVMACNHMHVFTSNYIILCIQSHQACVCYDCCILLYLHVEHILEDAVAVLGNCHNLVSSTYQVPGHARIWAVAGHVGMQN